MPRKNAGLAAATNSDEQKSQIGKELATKRWNQAKQSDEELRTHFLNADLKEAFEDLYKMRTQCEMAAKILEDRHSHAEKGEYCAKCGVEFTANVRPYTIKPVRDPRTQMVTNVFYCSLSCQASYEQGLNRPEAVVAQRS